MDDPSLQGDFLGLYYSCAHSLCPEAMLSGSSTVRDAVMPERGDVEGAGKNLDPLAVKHLVVIDGQARIRCWRALARQPYWENVVVLHSRKVGREYLSGLDELGILHFYAGDDRVDLAAGLDILGDEMGLSAIRVDSGGTLNGALLRQGLVDEVSLLVSPSLVGGTSPKGFFTASDVSGPDQVVKLSLRKVETLAGGVLWLRYDAPQPASGPRL